MCSPARCGRCGKATWSGCGKYFDSGMPRVTPRRDAAATQSPRLPCSGTRGAKAEPHSCVRDSQQSYDNDSHRAVETSTSPRTRARSVVGK